MSSAIATCKRSFYVAKVKNLKNTNTSRWWREVKNLSGISGNSGQWYRQLIDGQIIDSVDKLCLKINEFFAGLTSSFTPLDSSDISNIVVHDVPEDLLVSSHEAYEALRSVRVRKAAGPDDIPNIVLKVFAFELAPVIADLYNSSLRNGYLPALFKMASVCPLPKVGLPKSIESDIRPISLTSQIAKLMEGFTLSRILPNIIPSLDPKQFAVAGKSTDHAIVYLLHLALEALDRGNCWIRFFFADFKKAFDMIDHKILMSKVASFNLHPCLVRWIAVFLEGRTQLVSIETSISTPLCLNGGIPQGTKLGPLLFAIMVDDLMLSWCPRAKFVDDLTLLEIVPRNSPSIMQYLVSDIQSFARNNNMCLNPTKCKEISIDFLQYNGHVRLPITTGGTEIGCVKSFKLLGVYLSSDLTWATHVDYVLKKANRRLYALRQLKRCGVLPADIVKVYCSLVRSVVEYASVVFSNLPQYLVDALEKLQKRALKIIYPNYSYEAALDAANLEKLECRRVNICSSFVSKLTKSNPVYNLVSGRLKSRTVRYNLRVKQSTTTKLHAKTDRFGKFVTCKFSNYLTADPPVIQI